MSRDYYCVRPSQLALRRNPAGQFVVDAILRTVCLTELQLRERNSSRSFDIFVTRLGDGISIGDTVDMKLMPNDGAIQQPSAC